MGTNRIEVLSFYYRMIFPYLFENRTLVRAPSRTGLLLSARIKLSPSFSTSMWELSSFLPVYCSLLDVRNAPGSSPGGDIVIVTANSIYVLSITFPMMAEYCKRMDVGYVVSFASPPRL